eukprot:115054-Amphidinium_carterae.1
MSKSRMGSHEIGLNYGCCSRSWAPPCHYGILSYSDEHKLKSTTQAVLICGWTALATLHSMSTSPSSHMKSIAIYVNVSLCSYFLSLLRWRWLDNFKRASMLNGTLVSSTAPCLSAAWTASPSMKTLELFLDLAKMELAT